MRKAKTKILRFE